jgi:hypothetical protein
VDEAILAKRLTVLQSFGEHRPHPTTEGRSFSDAVRIRIGRGMAAYAVAAAVTGVAIYLSLGLGGQMLTDWKLHAAVTGTSIGVLVWLIVPLQPRNGAVWALIWAAVFQATNGLALGIAQWRLAALGFPSDLSVLRPAELPLGTALILQLTNWLWIPGVFLLVTLAILLFPDGRLSSPGRRWIARWSVASMAALAILFMVAAWPTVDAPAYSEEGMADLPGIFGTAITVGFSALMVGIVASIAALVGRFRASTGVERQQFRWIAWGASLMGVAIALLLPAIANPAFNIDPARIAAAVLMPFFIASYVVAVARYRLYEIDRVISRTASYAIVTALLALTYVGAVLSLQALLAPVTGGSELAVAASTLLVAAAFVPVRSRVQSLVDRRFNRTVYDARLAVDEFAQSLRGEVELDAVRDELADVAVATVQPTHASVWLAGSDDSDERGESPAVSAP